jgi:hypothetical protein
LSQIFEEEKKKKKKADNFQILSVRVSLKKFGENFHRDLDE